MLLHQKFISVAKKQPDKLAIKDKATGRDLTYGRALLASLLLAKRFEAYKGNFVGIMLPTSAGAILGIIGTLMAGKIPVMINYSSGAAENCQYAQEKCSFTTIITSRKLMEKIGCPLINGMIFLEDLMETITPGEKVKAALRAKMPTKMIMSSVHKGELDDDALILFTSGSEKAPKAVELTHRNLIANINGAQERFKLDSTDVILSILPYFHVFGQTITFWLPIFCGMTIVTHANPLEYRTVV